MFGWNGPKGKIPLLIATMNKKRLQQPGSLTGRSMLKFEMERPWTSDNFVNSRGLQPIFA